ncbi:MAG: hypothetical protein GX453_08030 [Lactococcus chungangensis]|uniref:Uncharacterized protein n=1 Tax=Pseudolactococcus chungangensis TaxID=451457 RepID=A0A847J4U3_9LACT|nr:hypothetical protein [Lactococcus chungangensis]
MELKATKTILVKNIDPVLLAKVDNYARLKKSNRSQVIRSMLDLRFSLTEGSLYDSQLTFEQIAKYSSLQLKRNEMILNKILEVINEK